MGKAQKIKEQRKIERVRREIKKEQNYKMASLIIAGIFVGALLGAGVYFGTLTIKNKYFASKTNTSTKSYKTGDRVYSQVPDMQIDTNKKYLAKFETSQGNFEVTLDPSIAPKTVNNFVVLAKDKFYDGLSFHRIVKDFMIQGGDPKGDGTSGPGYKFDDEEVKGDYTEGTIAMANSDKNTNGSQFFIMTGDYSNGKLPKNYVIFGKVSNGMEVVKFLNNLQTTANGSGENSKPVNVPLIKTVTIEEVK